MRSAWKPRSCSPIGPAPTREPRIALPPEATVVSVSWVTFRLPLGGELGDQTKHHDATYPHHAEHDGDAVKVTFGHP